MKSENNKLYNLKSQSRKAIFKQDDFMIGSCCIKNTRTLTSIIDQKDI